MQVNFHTHTFRCRHAVGSEREYIEQAIAGGLQVLGFSDHAPQPFPGTYCSGFRMEMEQAEDYFNTLKELQKEYRSQIQILIGLECEYYPALFETLLSVVKPMGLDYLLLGQHALYNEQGAPMVSQPTKDPAVLHQYVKQVKQGLATGEFLYLAHPDIVRFEGDETIYQAEMTDLCLFCKEHQIPLEINLLGLMEKRHYPVSRFWKIAKAIGNQAVIGYDAHKPAVLSQTELYQQGAEWAYRYGIPIVNNTLWNEWNTVRKKEQL